LVGWLVGWLVEKKYAMIIE